jgi:predicted transcriptional regulator
LPGNKPPCAFPGYLCSIKLPERWQPFKALTGAGPVTIREAARRVGRDVKAVHGDVHALLNAGLLDKTKDGKIVFPYDAIHVDFVVKAA